MKEVRKGAERERKRERCREGGREAGREGGREREREREPRLSVSPEGMVKIHRQVLQDGWEMVVHLDSREKRGRGDRDRGKGDRESFQILLLKTRRKHSTHLDKHR